MKTNNHKISLILLRESLWGVEDKLKVVMDMCTEHEAKLNNMKTQVEQLSTTLNQRALKNNGKRK